MGIKSNSVLAAYFNRFGASGTDASGPSEVTYTEATGGVISDYTDPGPGKHYRSHIFTASGTFTVSQAGSGGNSDVEYLVVSGAGGGGAGYYGGGGGAGGVRTNLSGHPLATGNPSFSVSTSPGSYTVTVGGGGGGGAFPGSSNSGEPGSQGIDSYFGPPSTPAGIAAKGGGKGMGRATSVSGATDGYPGGSGGGGGYRTPVVGYGYNPSTPAPIVPNIPSTHPYGITQGNNGGFCDGTAEYGSGGGGAGGVGADGGGPLDHGADGGAGSQILIAGPPTTSGVGAPGPGGTFQWFAGGGAGGGGGTNHADRYGGGANPTGANTGTGPFAGGGNSGDYAEPTRVAESGTAATGGGGGAGSATGGGAGGGSGIVVVRYERDSAASTAKATGGSVSYYGGQTIHTFVNSGTFATEPTWTSATVEYVVVGGGGGGGKDDGGGGGAGAVRFGTTPIGAHPVSTSIQVGGGGAGQIAGTSSFFGPPITSPGGGYGGTDPSPDAGGGGGSGGGGSGGFPDGAGGTGSGDPYPGSPPDASPVNGWGNCLLYTSPSPRDRTRSRMPSSA